MNIKYIGLLILIVIGGCASTVDMINGSKVNLSASDCVVTIHQTQRQAEKKGPIEELCMVKESSGVFFSIASAIEENKKLICQCGATEAYVQSSSGDGFWTPVTVTLVGFKYFNLKNSGMNNNDTSDRSRRCHAKGGSLINDVCRISLE